MRLVILALILIALALPVAGVAKSGPPPKATSGPTQPTPVVDPKATPTLGPLYLPVLEVPDGH